MASFAIESSVTPRCGSMPATLGVEAVSVSATSRRWGRLLQATMATAPIMERLRRSCRECFTPEYFAQWGPRRRLPARHHFDHERKQEAIHTGRSFVGHDAMRLTVHCNRRVAARRVDEAKDVSCLLAVPVVEVLHVVLRLGLQVGGMRSGDRLLRHARLVLVDVDE